MPLVTGLWPLAADLVGEALAELAAPGANGFVGEGDTAYGHHLLHVAVTEGKVEVQPDAMGDDLRRKAVTMVEGGGCAHRSTLPKNCPRWPPSLT